MADELIPDSGSARRQAAVRRGALALGLAGVGVVCVMYGPIVWRSIVLPSDRVSYARQVKFDSSAWRRAASGSADRRVRARMVDDLLESNVLVGRTLADAYELLGQPDVSRWSDQYPFPAYRLGRSSTSDFDSSDLPLILVHDKGSVIVKTVTFR